jgi:exo-beta-1,3-glucanase (GH17 family)
VRHFLKAPVTELFFLGLLLLVQSCRKDVAPSLTTSAITNITGTTATSGGTITSEGSGTIIAKGVCWSEGIHPTIANKCTTEGAGSGSFISKISELKGLTKYFLRAYATNRAGTSYGNEISFITNSTFTGPIFYNNAGKIINAVCYGFYRDGQSPSFTDLTVSMIKEDLLIIKNHWDAIRLYTSDDNTERIIKVISDNNIDLKVMLGIWISGKTPVENAAQVDRAIIMANTYSSIIQAVSCGNEIFLNPGSDIYVSNKSEIIQYLKKIHNETTVPVTIDEGIYIWLDPDYTDLVMRQDFLSVHIYGQWSNIPLENTLSFISDTYNQLRNLYPQKQILITESGWTTSKNAGQFNPVADEVSQKQFYTEFHQWSNSKEIPVFYFEAFNERWKGPMATEAETNWGFYYADRTPKLVFQSGK